MAIYTISCRTMDRPRAVTTSDGCKMQTFHPALMHLNDSASVYCTLLFGRFAGQRKSWFRRASVQYLLCEVFSKHGPMFEPVPGTSAGKPHVIYLRVPVDQKITVRSIFV